MDSTPLTPLGEFRRGAYACFTRAADALFEVGDALLTEDRARSFVELSQAPGFQRRWPSLYAALRDGQIDRDALRRLMVARLPGPAPGDRLVLGVDTSPIHRPEAHTAADRTLVYNPNLPAGSVPVRPGWSFSTVAVLPDPPSSWTYLLDNQRVPSTATATTVGAQQLATVVPLLPARPLLLGDGHYGSTTWVVATAGLPCDQLLRTRRDRVLYRPAPPRTGKRGAPKKDGPRFKGSDPATHGSPDAEWVGTDAAGRTLSVTAWTNLHLKPCRDLPITVLRVTRAGAAGTTRDPQESWFWWVGGDLPPLATIPPLYARRFGLEHGYRFDKQALLWEAPRVRTPEQFQRWTDLVALGHNQVVLARPWATVTYRPWDATARPVTPPQVRRAMPRILAQVGTPARPPRPRGKSPGRAPGTVVRRATRHPVIRKDRRRAVRRASSPARPP
jgi:DDE superfamily endonuclease